MAREIRDLVQRAAAGEKKALNTLIDQTHPLVWRILRKFSNLSSAEQEDLSQDVFIILLTRGLQSFRGSTDHEFHWYVKTITENEAKTYLHKRGRRLEVPDLLSANEEEKEATPPQADPAPGPEETVAGQEELGKLRHCLQALSSTDQEIFWMRERGYSYQEITGTLGLPLGTAGVKYSRAKEKIAECLKKAGIFGHGRKNEA